MYLYRCPACDYIAEHITLVHMRTHGTPTKEAFHRRYGKPISIDYIVPSKVKRWAEQMSTDMVGWNVEGTRWYARWARQ